MHEPVKWKYNINESGEIVFKATVERGWKLYDMNIPEGGPIPTSFSFDEVKGAELVGKLFTNTKTKSQYEEVFKMNVPYFSENPTFIQKLKITDKEKFLISGSINFMSCNNESCVPGNEVFKFTAEALPEKLGLAKEVGTVSAVQVKTVDSDTALEALKPLMPLRSIADELFPPLTIGNPLSPNCKTWAKMFQQATKPDC